MIGVKVIHLFILITYKTKYLQILRRKINTWYLTLQQKKQTLSQINSSYCLHGLFLKLPDDWACSSLGFLCDFAGY